MNGMQNGIVNKHRGLPNLQPTVEQAAQLDVNKIMADVMRQVSPYLNGTFIQGASGNHAFGMPNRPGQRSPSVLGASFSSGDSQLISKLNRKARLADVAASSVLGIALGGYFLLA